METTTEPTRIVICGPNLHTRDATFHVHAPGCADLRHYGPYGRRGGEDRGHEVEIEPEIADKGPAYAASRWVYECHISDYGYSYDSPEAVAYWEENEMDFRVFPCVRKAAKS
jgi:hypothetical protein